MADETTTAVLDSQAPTEPSSPPADGAAPAEERDDRSRQVEAYRKLQSERDQARAAIRRLEEQVAELATVAERAKGDSDAETILSKAPDALTDPDSRIKYLEAAVKELARQNREQPVKLDQLNKQQQRTAEAIDDRLERFHEQYGVRIDRNDERLGLLLRLKGVPMSQGLAALDDLLAVIAKQVEAEKRVKRETARELGATVFDGGTSGGGAQQTSGFTREQISDPEFYRKNRDAILEAYRRGEFDSLAPRGRA